jgi:hypothetical protein
VVEWINDKVVAAFGRHEAPVLPLPEVLQPGEVVFILSALIPNRKGQPLMHHWFGVTFYGNSFQNIEPFEQFLSRTGLGRRRFPNKQDSIDLEALRALLPQAVQQAKKFMTAERKAFEDAINEKLEKQLRALERLRGKQHRQLELFYQEKKQLSRKEQERREIDHKFDEFIQWVEDTMTTEDNPFIQVIAVLKGDA